MDLLCLREFVDLQPALLTLDIVQNDRLLSGEDTPYEYLRIGGNGKAKSDFGHHKSPSSHDT